MALSDLSLSLHSVLIHSKDLPDTASLLSAIALARKVKEFKPKIKVFAVGWTAMMANELVVHAQPIPMAEIWNAVRMRS